MQLYRKEAVKDTVVSYTSRNEITKVLIEATGNENWNIPNSKLQILADACCSQENYQNIIDHFKLKLESPPFEWRRILKSLTGLEYILKNGPPRVQQDLRNDMFKITTLQNFSYFEDNVDKGQSIREKSILISDLLSCPAKLEQEREQSRMYREKFYPGSGSKYANEGYGHQGSISNQSYSSGSIGNAGGDESRIGALAKGVGGVAVGVASGVASGVGSALSSGMSYFGWKGNNPQKDLYSGGMGGYGNDTQPYGGYYNPPSNYENSNSLMKPNSYQQPKWGASQTQNIETQQYKPMDEPQLKKGGNQNWSAPIKNTNTINTLAHEQNKNKTKAFEEVDKDQKNKKKKTHKKKSKKHDEESESSSEEEASSSENEDVKHKSKKSKKTSSKKEKQEIKEEVKKQPKEQEINLLEFDEPKPQAQQPSNGIGFDFLGQTSCVSTQAVQSQNLLDFDNQSTQQNQNQNSFFFIGGAPQIQQQNVYQSQNFYQPPQQEANAFAQMNGLSFQNQQQTQQQANLFQNLKLNESKQDETPKQEPSVRKQTEDNNDAWALGKSFINLNLKEQTLNDDTPSFLKKSNQPQLPLNLKPQASNNVPKSNFIPGVLLNNNQGTLLNVQQQQQMMNQMAYFQSNINNLTPQQIQQLQQLQQTQQMQQMQQRQQSNGQPGQQTASPSSFGFLQQSNNNQQPPSAFL